MLALFLQDGLGYSPLRSGLSVTPFAIGVASSAVIAGRLVPRFGRWLTVCGLTAIAAGLLTTALLLRHTTGPSVQWVIIGPLLVAGLGGGMVTSPNVTLTLENVPVRMAGAASGALQTVQRIGAAIGSATLATIFYHVLNQTDHDYQAAVSDALLGTCAFILLTLLIALGEVTWRRHHLGHGHGDQPRRNCRPHDHGPRPMNEETLRLIQPGSRTLWVTVLTESADVIRHRSNLGRGQLDRRGSDIVVQVRHRSGAGDRQDRGRSGQQPGQHYLSRCRVVALR